MKIGTLMLFMYIIEVNRLGFEAMALKRLEHVQYILYEGHLESKERFAIQRYLLLIGKKKNMQVLWHIFTYFST